MLTFIEDEGNGTLGEAFTKIHIKRDKKQELKNVVPKIGGLFKKKTKNKKDDEDDDDQQQQQQHHPSHCYTVEKSLCETAGFNDIVNRMDNGYHTKLSAHPPHEQPRVLIAHVSPHVGRQLGTVQKGDDVITHVNGQEFSGGTVKELQRILVEQYHRYNIQLKNDNDNDNDNDKQQQIRLELVVNAEHCIAQALQLRSI